MVCRCTQKGLYWENQPRNLTDLHLILARAASSSVQHVGATVLVAASTALRTQDALAHPSSGPLIQLPGRPTPSAPSLHPQAVINPLQVGIASGYNFKHTGYQATRAKMASTAYAGNSGHIILVELRVVRLPEGKVKPILIGVS